MSAAVLYGLTSQQADRLHVRWQLIRWNPDLHSTLSLAGLDWATPLAAAAALAAMMLPQAPLPLAAALTAAAVMLSYAHGVRWGRRQRVRELCDRLLLFADLHSMREADALVARTAGDTGELERRLSRLS